MQTFDKLARLQRKPILFGVVQCAGGILINLAGVQLAHALKLPLFLNCLGTILTAALGGMLPGILTGYLTNLFIGIFDPTTAYYGTISVFIAVLAAVYAQKGFFKKLPQLLIPIFTFALVGGALGSVLTWMLSDFDFGSDISSPFAQAIYNGTGWGVFLSQITADTIIDLADKTVVCILAAVILRLVPERCQALLRFQVWQQTPLSESALQEARHQHVRRYSLRGTLMLLISLAALLIAVGATGISALLYHRTTVEEHTKLGQGVTALVAGAVDPDRVEDYLALGEAAEGYLQTEEQLYTIRDSSKDIEFIYVYKIEPDGCHVVFDLDTEEIPASDPGEVIPFDESFADYLPDLLAGNPIDPIITDDTYGWLLTVYQPVYDAEGVCRCYAAADISMGLLTQNEMRFMVRVISLFLGFFIFILVLGMVLADNHIILPINTMATCAGAFAYNSEAERAQSVERLKELDIHTGDEIENLYRALTKTTGDSMQYISDIQKKNATISKMQNGLILVLADMVESRDQCTGDHVRKTAAYVRAIMDQMRRDGIYSDLLTEEFMEDVVNSAPLHDVGKIRVSDNILNKPGKLTDTEFELMKEHTSSGGSIIAQAIALVSDTGYLEEAKNLATFHHERWDGKGYPSGLAGEQIPLSARIMAVADVFDALVSRRSYKAPFSFEKAMEIIREESGTHFDPQVVEAFLHAEDEVRRISETFFEE